MHTQMNRSTRVINTYNHHITQASIDHHRPDDITRLLYRQNPRFDSAKQFGFFARVVIDEWQHSTPGLSSSWGVFAEMERLGTRVQTSINPKHTPSPHVYHVAMVRSVLEQSVLRLAGELPDDPVESAKALDRARAKVQAWGQMDILGRKQRSVATDFKVAPSVISDRVMEARDAVYSELAMQGLAGEEPSRRHRRRVLVHRMVIED